MSKQIFKTAKKGEWEFNVKLIAGVKVSEKSGDVSGVANITLVGDTAYLDSQLSSNADGLSIHDYRILYDFCRSLGMRYMAYDRIKKGVRLERKVRIKPLSGDARSGADVLSISGNKPTSP